MDIEDAEACYQAVRSRDRRFDGIFYTAVRSTGIYCRPSCPARTPHRRNVTFHRTAAAAQAAGYRACKRCLPDATPGSPRWDLRADVAGRAMRLIADGTVEREGVSGLAGRLGYSTRHLTRLLTAEVGAGPLALARAQRAVNARILLETTPWRLAEIAFAAGFGSVRQFNDTFREVYDAAPSDLRRRRRPDPERDPGPAAVDLRLAVRHPFDGVALWSFLHVRAVPGVEASGPGWYARSLALPRGPATVRLELSTSTDAAVRCQLRVSDWRDLGAAVERCRRLVDADCDPVAVDAALGRDPFLRGSVLTSPGTRVPGHVDGNELALRAVLGQQVSVARGVRLAERLVTLAGRPLPRELVLPGVDRLFPAMGDVAELDPGALGMPGARARALVGLAQTLAAGAIPLDRSGDRAEVRRLLLGQPGIGPWTADYVAMRALGDVDVLPPNDAVVRRVLRAAGLDEERTRSWRPWRSYALMHLWTMASGGES